MNVGRKRAMLILLITPTLLAGAKHSSSPPVSQPDRDGGVVNELRAIREEIRETGRPKAERSECANGVYAEQSELCAQWKAANAASRSADYDWWTLVIGWVGTVFGVVTMAAAIAAALYAKLASEESRSANRLFREHVRAKLITENLAFEMPAVRPDNRHWPSTFKFQVDNLGDTVAHKAKFVVTAHLLDRRRPVNQMRSKIYVGAVRLNGPCDVAIELKIDPNDWAEVARDRVNRVLIRLEASYEDVFGERTTEDRWLLGVTRKRGLAGVDHFADGFRTVDPGFIVRLKAKANKEFRVPSPSASPARS